VSFGNMPDNQPGPRLYPWALPLGLLAALSCLVITNGKIRGAALWGLGKGFDIVGAPGIASSLRFESMCATMHWEELHYTCKDAADRKRLVSELWRFRNDMRS
jgi:hypothetical protein